MRIARTFPDFVPTDTLPSQYDIALDQPPSPGQSPPPLQSDSLQGPSHDSVYRSPYVEDTVDEDEQQPRESQEEFEDEVAYDFAPNGFGVFHRYYSVPSKDPEADITIEQRCDAPGLKTSSSSGPQERRSIRWLARAFTSALEEADDDPEWEDDPEGITAEDIGPFANCSQFRLTDWWYGHSGTKSMVDYDDLLGVLASDGFELSHLKGFSAAKAEKCLDNCEDTDGIFSVHDGWHNSSVFVPLPKTHSKHKKEAQAPQLRVDGVYHRNFLSMIEGVVSDASTPYANNIHWLPHELWWYPADIPESSERTPTPKPPPEPIRVYTDCYNSSAMLEEDAQLRQQPRNPDDSPDVDYCVLPILIWSDATQLSSFGNAFVAYLRVLRQPIEVCPWSPNGVCSPTSCIHSRGTLRSLHILSLVADMALQLPDSVQDEYLKVFGVHASPDVLKFCRRELFQQIWLLLLDDEFMAAYEKGILLKCADGMVRRLFPRIFTYSADYPEKCVTAFTV